MLEPELLTPDQQETIDRLYEHDATLVVAPMGGGKTVCTLTAISELMRDDQLSRVLVVAPLKVCQQVWRQEAEKWAHLSHITVGVATGSPDERVDVLAGPARVVVVNFENLVWLLKTQRDLLSTFDGFVVDELSKLKNAGGAIFKALRPRLAAFTWRVGLTGTPVSENWEGLYAQMLVVDLGAALGRSKDNFLRTYFSQQDYKGYQWALQPDGAERISRAIRGAVWNMPDYRDQLPPIIYDELRLKPPPEVLAAQDQMTRDMVAELEGSVITAETAAAAVGKLQQIASGFIYREGEPPVLISDFRIKAVQSLVAKLGRSVVVCYWFKTDYDRLKEAFKHAADMSEQGPAAADSWNARAAQILLLHPRSAGHGLNLAAGGADIIWLGPQWSRDLWEQANARLWRRGQTGDAVRVWTLIAEGTIDQTIAARVAEKAGFAGIFASFMKKGPESGL